MNADATIDPDYHYIEVLFKRAADLNSIVLDWIFDWHDTEVNEKEQHKSETNGKRTDLMQANMKSKSTQDVNFLMGSMNPNLKS